MPTSPKPAKDCTAYATKTYVHTTISVVMEAAMRAVRQQHSGPARQTVALGNMFAGGLPFNGNNRTFIARL